MCEPIPPPTNVLVAIEVDTSGEELPKPIPAPDNTLTPSEKPTTNGTPLLPLRNKSRPGEKRRPS
ncbi:UNVERIFIED_CONTAM: hypothetical protein Slati_1095700 [Sesamum latifolium]|uniref:Uncharacterized protein n=1 Tax=Sesamum latifolium TaxID=2727402 RepID=A0AAW2XVE3_9LAMI